MIFLLPYPFPVGCSQKMPLKFGVGLSTSTKAIKITLQVRFPTELILICSKSTFKQVITSGEITYDQKPLFLKMISISLTS